MFSAQIQNRYLDFSKLGGHVDRQNCLEARFQCSSWYL